MIDCLHPLSLQARDVLKTEGYLPPLSVDHVEFFLSPSFVDPVEKPSRISLIDFQLLFIYFFRQGGVKNGQLQFTCLSIDLYFDFCIVVIPYIRGSPGVQSPGGGGGAEFLVEEIS